VERALAKLPNAGTVIVIAHGGSIAAACLISQGLPVSQIIAQIPMLGQIVFLPNHKP
jgi:hypothetical protein